VPEAWVHRRLGRRYMSMSMRVRRMGWSRALVDVAVVRHTETPRGERKLDIEALFINRLTYICAK